MTTLRVTHSHRDEDGDIIGLCLKGAEPAYVSRADAIAQIMAGTHEYVVAEESPPVAVLARPKDAPTYLTTEADGASKNNLENLGSCEPPT